MARTDIENGRNKNEVKKRKSRKSTNLSSQIGGNLPPTQRKKPSRMVRILRVILVVVILALCATATVFVLRIFVFAPKENEISVGSIEEEVTARMVVMEVTERKLAPLEINGPQEEDALAKARAGSRFQDKNSFDGERRRRLDEIGDWESQCDPCEYYKSITNWGVSELRSRLEENVRILDYTDRNDPLGDTWKALADVDRVDINGAEEVRLIYTNKTLPSSRNQSGTSERMDRWNREHLWPKARGVGYHEHDPKHNDVHHLFPSDVNTNSNARGNRYFDVCDDHDDCRAWEMSANGATIEYDGIRYEASNTGKFQPPENARGIVARAILYMDLRYPELELTNNPDPNNKNQMGNLATLLQWHEEYPPNQREAQRNNRVCSKWQGNRNPFVDFPDLAKSIYGDATIHQVEKDLSLTCGKGSETHDEDPSPGEIMVVGVHSDNPDVVALVALRALPKGWVIRITDNAYDGNSFKTNEGTLSLTLSKTIPAGMIFGYGPGMLYGNAWDRSGEDQNFDLSVSGDTVTVCAATDRNPDVCTILSAVSVAGGRIGDLPKSISDFSVVVGSLDNYVYTGETKGGKESLQKDLIDTDYWMGSNEKTSIPGLKDYFEITEPFTTESIDATIGSSVESISFAEDLESTSEDSGQPQVDWWVPDWLVGRV
eukprot:CAMPEP_0116134272 /NCGR_PEP_ID=MMETSP0329-20121206/10556_1 /TAXON_ID=697910 /ORGANISM="Pseudo-nitzschia arenysensis, Strain B593" /LENGTH=659 /DNA_ID=CAMNT_0003628969 /DNA_START=242 /DNA_END=2221 /DNA_ORIENTATION=-